jgi:hypothetical protein
MFRVGPTCCTQKRKGPIPKANHKSPYNANASKHITPTHKKLKQNHHNITTVKLHRKSPRIPKRISPSTHHPPRSIASPTQSIPPDNLRRRTTHPRRPSRMHARRIRVHIARNASHTPHRAGATNIRPRHSASRVRHRRQGSSGQSRVAAGESGKSGVRGRSVV